MNFRIMESFAHFGRCDMIAEVMISALNSGASIKFVLMIIRMSAVFLLKRLDYIYDIRIRKQLF